MERLPPEIFKICMQYLTQYDDYGSRADLKSLRLASKWHSSAAAEYLFAKVPVWIGLNSLQNLTSISEHRYLSSYVKTVVFSALSVRPISDGKTVRRATDHLERICHSMNNFNLALGRYLGGYKRLIDDQEYLSERDMNCKLLMRALRNLPNMDTLEICDGWTQYIGAGELYRSLGFLTGFEISLLGNGTLPVLFRALSEAPKRLRVFRILGAEDYTQPYLVRNVELQDRPEHQKPPALPDNCDHHFLSPEAIGLAIKDFEQRHKVFGQLKELKIDPYLWARCCLQEDLEAVGTCISLIFIPAQKLRSLSIGYLGEMDDATPTLNMARNMRTALLGTYLQHLRLCHLEASEADLVSLLGKRHQTLETIHLSEVEVLPPSSWILVLRALRKFAFPVLREFELSCCEDVLDEVSVIDYIRGRTEKTYWD